MQSYNSFQFHKGTIKTPKNLGLAGAAILFQFHKGTIKTSQFQE